jgi:uncharacterized SAM-binding protein YcdF (DUF218 family)
MRPNVEERRRERGRRSSPWRAAVVALLAVTVLGGLLLWGVSDLGRWLIVADTLERASAAVVMSGGVPFRAIEAAAIYRNGWVREVWITRTLNPAVEAVLNRLRLDLDFRDEWSNRLILERLGVSPGDIRVLAPGARNTAEELKVVARELARTEGDRVILVTSKSHSRRVRATWRAVVGKSPGAVVRYAESDPFDGTRWWERTSDALAVSREVFGLMNVWAGFPVRPDRPEISAQPK